MAERRRVYEIAKEMNVSSKSLLALFHELDYDLKSHMGTVTDEMMSALQNKLQSEKNSIKEAAERKKEIKRRVEISRQEETRKQQTAAASPAVGTVVTPTGPKAGDVVPIPGEGKGKKKKRKRDRRRKVDKKQVAENVKKTLTDMATGPASKSRRKFRRTQVDEIALEEAAAAERRLLQITEFVSVRELAERLDTEPGQIIGKCLELGMMVSINQRLDKETIELIATEFDYEVELLEEYGEDLVDPGAELEEQEDEVDESKLQARPPIVTIMGHVDHGKTQLLDYIRKENVIAGEAGGITQHIGAYSVRAKQGVITFLDTPGHETFTAMRARGAQLTDVAIIIIAADDGVMPQTKEAISHAKAAGIPMIIAINKMDLPTANPDRLKQQLAENDVLLESWGGKVQSVEISAKTGMNVEQLLDTVLLETDLLELKANPDKMASGVVIEAELDKGKGPVSTILVQDGTLRRGDPVIAGLHHGRVKAMFDEYGRTVQEAGPSKPVRILGLNGVPQAGDKFHAIDDMDKIKEISTKRQQIHREQGFRQQGNVSLDDLQQHILDGRVKSLPVIIKGDVDGSIEAIADSLMSIQHEDVRVNIIHRAVGPIMKSDVFLAAASNAIIIGFHVKPDGHAREIAEKEKVEIRYYRIIYEVVDDIRAALEGMLDPDKSENVTGTAEVLKTIKISSIGIVAGCLVNGGVIRRTNHARLIRDNVVVFDGRISSLKRFKDDVKEVRDTQECGITLDNYKDVREGDRIEAYEIVETARKLDS